MSTNNQMTLCNQTSAVIFQNFSLIKTNSGQDISVLAGSSLNSRCTNAATFNVDKGTTDTFSLVLWDQTGKIWQGLIVCDLNSSSTSTVSVNVTGSLGELTMGLYAGSNPIGSPVSMQPVQAS